MNRKQKPGYRAHLKHMSKEALSLDNHWLSVWANRIYAWAKPFSLWAKRFLGETRYGRNPRIPLILSADTLYENHIIKLRSEYFNNWKITFVISAVVQFYPRFKVHFTFVCNHVLSDYEFNRKGKKIWQLTPDKLMYVINDVSFSPSLFLIIITSSLYLISEGEIH